MSLRKTAIAAMLLFTAMAPRSYSMDISAFGALGKSNANITPISGTVTTSADSAFGVGAALTFSLLSPLLDLQVGALYLPRKIDITINGSLDTEKMNTIQFPVLIRCGILPFINVGFGGYFWVGTGNISDITAGGETLTSFSAAGFKTTDFGLVASIALSFPILPRVSLVFDGRYLVGMTNLSTAAGASYKTRDLQILGGAQISL